MALGMARSRDERGTRYPDDPQYSDDDRDRRHRRRHKHREYADDPDAARRERRERRRADDARREAELDIDDLRARRESYARPSSDRHRDQDPMVREIRLERPKDLPRTSQRELRRDGTRRTKRRDTIPDDRSDDYVYSRPKSRGFVEEADVRRSSARKRSEEGGSSSRTAYTPRSGSGSASVRRVEIPKLSR